MGNSWKTSLENKKKELSEINKELNNLTRKSYDEYIMKELAPKLIGNCYIHRGHYIMIVQPPKLLEGRCEVNYSSSWGCIKINNFEDETPYGCYTDSEIDVAPYYNEDIDLFFLLNYPKNFDHFQPISRDEFNVRMDEAIRKSKELIEKMEKNITPRKFYRF